MPEPQRVHLLTATHTPRHLAGLLAGLSRQIDPPDTITVGCDTDDPAIGEVIAAWRPRLTQGPVRWVRRPHTGEARPAQARNNGLRALLEAGELQDANLILQIDGDMVLSDTAVGRYRELGTQGFEVVIADRVNLTEEETAAFDAEAYAATREPMRVSDEEMERLRSFQRLCTRRLRRRAFWWSKPHHPSLLGGQNALTVRVSRAVNGYDEEYVGWGREDGDFSRRINSLRPRLKMSISVDSILGFHLWHPTRRPKKSKQSSSYARFKRKDLPQFCAHGLMTPREQPVISCTIIE